MSTAELAPRTFDENASAVVAALLATRRMDAVELAPQIGMTKSTLYNRLSGKAWLAAELDRIAAYFNVSPAVFFRPVEALFGDQKFSLLMRPDLRVLPGEAESTTRSRGHLASIPRP